MLYCYQLAAGCSCTRVCRPATQRQQVASLVPGRQFFTQGLGLSQHMTRTLPYQSCEDKEPVFFNSLKRVQSSTVAALATLKQQAANSKLVKPSAKAVEQFDGLWFAFAQQLELSKEVAQGIAHEVYQGRLPCDAEVLRSRAENLLELDAQLPNVRLRQLLNSHKSTLKYPAALMLDRIKRLSYLLPSTDINLVLGTVMSELNQDPEVVALLFLELQTVMHQVFNAPVPAPIFSICAQWKSVSTYVIWERLQSLVQLVGREPAYVILHRYPAVCKIAAPDIHSRALQLQQLLHLDSLGLAALVENKAALLDLAGDEAQTRFWNLKQLLALDDDDLISFVKETPAVLLQPKASVLSRWQKVTNMCTVRKQWAWELETQRYKLAALALTCTFDALQRLDFMAATNKGQGVKLVQVLTCSKLEFLRCCPEYGTWVARQE